MRRSYEATSDQDCHVQAFELDLEYHEETRKRMVHLSKKVSLVLMSGGSTCALTASRAQKYNVGEQTEEQKKARDRMALFPAGQEVLYVQSDLWVPVVRVNGNVCIFPGVPTVSVLSR